MLAAEMELQMNIKVSVARETRQRSDDVLHAGNETKEANSLGVIDSQLLFHASNEVMISHDGMLYRLRRTKQNKLILTK